MIGDYQAPALASTHDAHLAAADSLPWPDEGTSIMTYRTERNQNTWALHLLDVCNMARSMTRELAWLPSVPAVLLHSQPIPPRVSILLEKPPVSEECQLKHAWNSEDRVRNASFSEDTLTFCGRRIIHGTYCIRGKIGFTKGLHVWEIHWPRCQRGTHAVVGVATRDAPLHCVVYQVLYGSNDVAWGWDIVQQKLYHGANNPVRENYPVLLKPEETYIVPDKFLVVLDMDNGTLSYIANGQYLGTAFHGLCGHKVFPIVSDVWGNSDVTLKYIGCLEPEPPSLNDLCRVVIRQSVGKHQLEERISELNLPQPLNAYLLYKDWKFDDSIA